MPLAFPISGLVSMFLQALLCPGTVMYRRKMAQFLQCIKPCRPSDVLDLCLLSCFWSIFRLRKSKYRIVFIFALPFVNYKIID